MDDQKIDSSTKSSTFFVEGMCCGEEQHRIEKKLQTIPGVVNCKFNLVNQKLNVVHTCSKDDVLRPLHRLGFKVREQMSAAEQKSFWEKHASLFFIGLSGLLAIAGILLEQFGIGETVTIPLLLGAILTGGWRIAIKGFKAAKNLSLDMSSLMTIAIMGAMAIGEWAEAAAVVFLFALAQLLEYHSIDRARSAIRSLMNLSPRKARILQTAGEIEVAVEEVGVGNLVIIRPGERIPLDGVVRGGHSTVNQSPLTGESIPVKKKPGDEVYAGTINENGTLEVKVSHLSSDSTLARIIHLIEEAQSQRAPSQSFIDAFARYYTPAVIGLAVVLAIVPPVLFGQPFGDWLYRALVLLVIACPCALVISTPVTIVSGLTNAARHGILIKGGKYLENAGQLRVIAIDKTGTLTEGSPKVTDIIAFNSLPTQHILKIAAAMEFRSEHHLAGAVLSKAYKENVPFDGVKIDRFESLTGRGVKAIIDGKTYYIGNHQLCEEVGYCAPHVEEAIGKLERQGKTVIVLAEENQALAVIGIADTAREESKRAIRRLRQNGIKNVIMLTGDNEATARIVADEIGVDEYRAGMLPEDKVQAIQLLQDRHGEVGMVGDGINDAPALAASNIGIAMGTAGTDTALETADVVLMSDDLSKVAYMMELSRKTLSIIKQNVLIALSTKLVFLVLGILGTATLWMAVLADDGAALVVILNGLRMLKLKDHS